MNCRKVLLIAAALFLGAGAAAADDSVKSGVSDATINAKVNAALVGDSQTKARQIDVEVADGVVQLNGFVDSTIAKTRAETLASQVAGVKAVRNNLEVARTDRSAGEAVDDGMITSKVKAALLADGTTKAYKINVTTRQGVVQLSGFVESDAAKKQAERLARSVSGVREVHNDLEVSG